MTAKLMDGKATAEQLYTELAEKVQTRVAAGLRPPWFGGGVSGQQSRL